MESRLLYCDLCKYPGRLSKSDLNLVMEGSLRIIPKLKGPHSRSYEMRHLWRGISASWNEIKESYMPADKKEGGKPLAPSPGDFGGFGGPWGPWGSGHEEQSW